MMCVRVGIVTDSRAVYTAVPIAILLLLLTLVVIWDYSITNGKGYDGACAFMATY